LAFTDYSGTVAWGTIQQRCLNLCPHMAFFSCKGSRCSSISYGM